MIRNTVKNVAKQLEHLSHYEIPLERSLDLLESRARTVEEMIVIEVMRESYQEVREQWVAPHHAEATSRTARMPAMAFRR